MILHYQTFVVILMLYTDAYVVQNEELSSFYNALPLFLCPYLMYFPGPLILLVPFFFKGSYTFWKIAQIYNILAMTVLIGFYSNALCKYQVKKKYQSWLRYSIVLLKHHYGSIIYTMLHSVYSLYAGGFEVYSLIYLVLFAFVLPVFISLYFEIFKEFAII